MGAPVPEPPSSTEPSLRSLHREEAQPVQLCRAVGIAVWTPSCQGPAPPRGKRTCRRWRSRATTCVPAGIGQGQLSTDAARQPSGGLRRLPEARPRVGECGVERMRCVAGEVQRRGHVPDDVVLDHPGLGALRPDPGPASAPASRVGPRCRQAKGRPSVSCARAPSHDPRTDRAARLSLKVEAPVLPRIWCRSRASARACPELARTGAIPT